MTSQRTAQENHFATHDGIDLFYRYWPATETTCRGAILLFHRGHEHSGRMAHLVDELDLPGYAFFAWDARGQGRSPGERGYSPNVATSVRDIQTFVDHISELHGVSVNDMFIVAQSLGAALVALWVHGYAPNIRGMVLASPAFSIKLYVPLAIPGLKLLHRIRGNFFVNSYVKARFLTHDRERIQSFNKDPLIARPISVNMLLDVHRSAQRVVADAAAITVPTQLLVSGSDFVVRHLPQHRFYERLGSHLKERHLLPGFFHDTLGERDRALALEKLRPFLVNCFENATPLPSLLDADKHGFTRREMDRLATPLPKTSWRGLYWQCSKWGLRLWALLSKGIKLGQRTGYDSGSTLDYVYRNQAQGVTFVGRLIDRVYLNAIGWRGIRQRKLHVEELIQWAMLRLHMGGQPVRILDVAAGHGRYILDAVQASSVQADEILLRDYSRTNVEKGRQLIAQRNLSATARFEVADAFDTASLAALNPGFTVGVISGLFELFSDNELVWNSLHGLANAIGKGGFLVYTGQPWHPQLEMIARSLTSHRQGQAWVMRRRTQAELDQLVQEAGFKKVAQRIDEHGIFTVSLAVRGA